MMNTASDDYQSENSDKSWQKMYNRLEPEALLSAFQLFPPFNFQVSEYLGGMPVFVADFDILTTMDPKVQGVLRTWVGRLGLQRWLLIRTLFVGTTVSEYALLPPHLLPETVLASLLKQYREDYLLLVIKDIPVQSPLLSDAENLLSAQWLNSGQKLGWLNLEGQALAFVRIEPDVTEAVWLSRFSKARRKDFRRKLRSRDGLVIRELRAGDAQFQSEELLNEAPRYIKWIRV